MLAPSRKVLWIKNRQNKSVNPWNNTKIMYADIGQGILAGIVVDIIDLPLFVHGVRRDSGLEFISGILGSIVGGC